MNFPIFVPKGEVKRTFKPATTPYINRSGTFALRQIIIPAIYRGNPAV